MDRERFTGLKSEIPNAELMVVPMEQEARAVFYREHLENIKIIQLFSPCPIIMPWILFNS